MNADTVLDLGRNAMYITLLVSAPMLLSGMVVGLIISVFQSVTQIQEITLTFVPKIIVVMVAFALFMPWMLAVFIAYVQPLFGGFDALVR
ncbi:MAG: flagellar biosynthesis protein FliQ [Candidatus Hydrogenedentes bacterium]|nr:flagellar biosynthesis protein FliQ [Candidatus Hydrogenedentota bacterium]